MKKNGSAGISRFFQKQTSFSSREKKQAQESTLRRENKKEKEIILCLSEDDETDTNKQETEKQGTQKNELQPQSQKTDPVQTKSIVLLSNDSDYDKNSGESIDDSKDSNFTGSMPNTTTTTTTTRRRGEIESDSTANQSSSIIQTIGVDDTAKIYTKVHSNPFARFAFKSSKEASPNHRNKVTIQRNHSSRQQEKITNDDKQESKSSSKSKQNNLSIINNNKRKNKKTSNSNRKTKSSKTSNTTTIPAETPEDICTFVSKWHSFADPNASIEDKRFQVFVAARLHAQTQESVVFKAMKILSDFFLNNNDNNTRTDDINVNSTTSSSSFNVYNMSKTNPDTLSKLLSFVHYGKTKCQHLVSSSQEIISIFDGNVPESPEELRKLKGIGPKLSLILQNVNTIKTYKEKSKEDCIPNAVEAEESSAAKL